MRSTMQDRPLLVRDIFRHGRQVHGIERGRDLSRATASGARASPRSPRRAEQLAAGARAPRASAEATAWRPSASTTKSTSRPTSPCPRMGAVLHTLNVRLFPDQLRLCDRPRRGQGDHRGRAARPGARAGARRAGERRARHRRRRRGRLGARRDARATRSSSRPRSRASTGPDLEETEAAAMCYTSGTTGQPQRRRLQPPLHLPALAGLHLVGDARDLRLRPDPRRRAPVPRQRLGRALRGLAERGRPDHAQAVPAGRAARADHREPSARPSPVRCRRSGTRCSATPRSTARTCPRSARSSAAAPPCRARSWSASRSVSACRSSRAGA